MFERNSEDKQWGVGSDEGERTHDRLRCESAFRETRGDSQSVAANWLHRTRRLSSSNSKRTALRKRRLIRLCITTVMTSPQCNAYATRQKRNEAHSALDGETAEKSAKLIVSDNCVGLEPHDEQNCSRSPQVLATFRSLRMRGFSGPSCENPKRSSGQQWSRRAT